MLHLYAWRLAKRLWRNAVLSSLQFVDVIYECTRVNRPQSLLVSECVICQPYLIHCYVTKYSEHERIRMPQIRTTYTFRRFIEPPIFLMSFDV